MRLQLARSLAVSSAAALFVRAAHGDGDVVRRASSEVSTYTDTMNVQTLTPSVGGAISRPVAGWSVDGRYLADIVSAASVDIVSTASRRWTEVRHAGSLSSTYKPQSLGATLGGSFSREPDYLSLSAAGALEHDFLQKNLTLSFGYGYSHDTIGRADTPFDVFSRTLAKHAIKPTVVWVLDRGSVLTVVGDVILERGDSSKPYRHIPMFTSDVAAAVPVGASIDLVNRIRRDERPLEQLPLERDRFALTTRYAHRTTRLTLRLEERVYGDSWGVAATTTDLRPIVDLSSRVAVWPHARLHAQTGASFWQRAYSMENGAVPALRTGDRELGPLASVTGGAGMRWVVDTRDRYALTGQLDVTYTSFFDALFVTRRLAAFLAIGVEAQL